LRISTEPPVWWINAAVSSSVAGDRPEITTCSVLRQGKAPARPIPVPPPVTQATLPDSALISDLVTPAAASAGTCSPSLTSSPFWLWMVSFTPRRRWCGPA
jgi:hypothetical protein